MKSKYRTPKERINKVVKNLRSWPLAHAFFLTYLRVITTKSQTVAAPKKYQNIK